LRDFKQISGAEFIDMSELKVKKLNKTHRGLIGSFTVKSSEIDNSVKVKAKLLKKQGGEYRLMPYNLPMKNICDFFNEDIVIVPELAKYSDIPQPVSCPLPAVSSTSKETSN
jgi:hypothetical protein